MRQLLRQRLSEVIFDQISEERFRARFERTFDQTYSTKLLNLVLGSAEAQETRPRADTKTMAARVVDELAMPKEEMAMSKTRIS